MPRQRLVIYFDKGVLQAKQSAASVHSMYTHYFIKLHPFARFLESGVPLHSSIRSIGSNKQKIWETSIAGEKIFREKHEAATFKI